MSNKPKLAIYGAGSCGGCDTAILSIYEKILDLIANFDIVFWPMAMDAKHKDVLAMPDKSITLCLFNGSIRNTENAKMARLLRRKSQILVAFGACAADGGIPGLANFFSAQSISDSAYYSITTINPEDSKPSQTIERPQEKTSLPGFLPILRTLDQVVEVDYFFPGCPPESHQIANGLDLLSKALHGENSLPLKGSALGAGISTVCNECTRARNVKLIKKFCQWQDIKKIDSDLCFLEQGILCTGPATRDGCGAKCLAADSPCIGCYGPAEGVIDFGARLITAFASVIDATKEEEIEQILDGIPDPAGQFYRFSLAKSLLRTGKSAQESH